MKTLQQIEKEYESFCVKTDVVNNLDDFMTFVEVGIADTEEYQRDYEKELKQNNRWKLMEKIHNFFFFVINDEIDDIYDSDSDVLRKCIHFTSRMRTFYKRIYSIATDENFQELVRLVDFSSDFYYAQTDYYDYERDQLDLYLKGIHMTNSKYEDNEEVFFEFMDKKLKSMECGLPDEKQVVYMKGRL